MSIEPKCSPCDDSFEEEEEEEDDIEIPPWIYFPPILCAFLCPSLIEDEPEDPPSLPDLPPGFPPVIPPVPPPVAPPLSRALIPNCEEAGYLALVSQLQGALGTNTGLPISSSVFDLVSAVNFCQVRINYI